MNKNKKWFIAVSVAAVITANGLVFAAANADRQDALNGKRPAFAEKGDFRGGMRGFAEDKTKLLELLQINEETFKAEMKAGKTLVTIAKEHSVSEEQLKDFIVKQMTSRIDEGVKAGKISAEQAGKMKADMEKHVTDMLSGKGPMHNGHGPRPGHGPFDDSKLLALLNVDAETLRSEMEAGKTLVTIAKEHGVSEEQLKDFMVKQMTSRIDEDVKAGKISAEQAEKMKADMEERVTDMLSGKGPMHKGHGLKPGRNGCDKSWKTGRKG